jgi:hypothetical protein
VRRGDLTARVTGAATRAHITRSRMAFQARIRLNVAPSPDWEPPRGPPGNVRHNANTARLAVATGLPDSDAILLPQMDTWQRIAPNMRYLDR